MTARHGSISDFFLKLSDLSLLLIALGVTIVYRYAPSENPTFVLDYLSERVKVTNAILGFGLLLTWALLATVYFIPVCLVAFYTDRDLNFRASWKLA